MSKVATRIQASCLCMAEKMKRKESCICLMLVLRKWKTCLTCSGFPGALIWSILNLVLPGLRYISVCSEAVLLPRSIHRAQANHSVTWFTDAISHLEAEYHIRWSSRLHLLQLLVFLCFYWPQVNTTDLYSSTIPFTSTSSVSFCRTHNNRAKMYIVHLRTPIGIDKREKNRNDMMMMTESHLTH